MANESIKMNENECAEFCSTILTCAHYTFVRNATMCSSCPRQTDRQSDRQKNVWRNKITGEKTNNNNRITSLAWIFNLYLSKFHYCVWFVHRTPAHSHFAHVFECILLRDFDHYLRHHSDRVHVMRSMHARNSPLTHCQMASSCISFSAFSFCMKYSLLDGRRCLVSGSKHETR